MEASARRAHPFVPIVRWVVFPTPAALAGAAAGGAAVPQHLAEAATIGATLSAAAAVGFSISTRPLIGLLVVPVLGILSFCGGYAVFEATRRRDWQVDAWAVFGMLITVDPAILTLLGTALAQTAAHYVERRRPAGLRRSGLVYGAWALAAGAVAAAANPRWLPLAAFAALVTLAQLVPMRLALWLSARMRRG
jgi:hypothetical protein